MYVLKIWNGSNCGLYPCDSLTRSGCGPVHAFQAGARTVFYDTSMVHDQTSIRAAHLLKALPLASEARRYQLLRALRNLLDPVNSLSACCDEAILGQCIRSFRKWGGRNAAASIDAFIHQRDNIRRIRRSLQKIQDTDTPLNRLSFSCRLHDASETYQIALKALTPDNLDRLQRERERQAAIGWGGFLPFLTHLLGQFPSDDGKTADLKKLIESIAWSMHAEHGTTWIWGLFIHRDQGITERIYLSFFDNGTGEDTFLATPITSGEAGEHFRASFKRARWAAARYLQQLTTDFDAASIMSTDMMLKIGERYHRSGFEGGSISFPVAVMLVAHALELSLPEHIAMTGDIDAEGRIQPVDGVDEKIRAAVESGLTCVVVPAGNMMETRHIPSDSLEIFAVRSLEEACDFIFRDALKDAGYQAFPIEAAVDSPSIAFTGRRHELVRLQQQINKTLSGCGGLTVIYGEAGVGKTRLMEEVRQYAQDTGMFVLTGACLYRQGAVPYWPFIDALMSMDDRDRRLTGRNWSEKIAEVRNRLNIIDGQEPQVLQRQLFDHLLSLAEILTDAAGAVIFIEDLQWCDSGGLQLVHYLARHAQKRRLRLIITYRSEETARKEQPSVSYFLDVLQQCATEGLSETMPLAPLDESECALLIAVLVKDRAIPAWFTDLVYKETQGNPLFIVELIKWWQEQGLIKDGRIGISPEVFDDHQNMMPPRILDVIAHRLRPLSEEDRTLLEIASVGGEQFDLADVIEIRGDVERMHLLQSVQRLEKKYGILKHRGGNAYQFSHSKIQEYIYSDQSEVLRKEYHRLWGELLLARKKKEEEAPIERLAVHLFQSGDGKAALPYLIEAGESAHRMRGHREARWYLEQAISILSDEKGYDLEKRVDIMLMLATTYYHQGHLTEAQELNNEAFKLCKRPEMDVLLGRTLHQLSFVVLAQGSIDKAKKLTEQSITIFRSINHKAGLITGLSMLGQIEYRLSSWDSALQYFKNVYQLLLDINDQTKIGNSLNNIGLIYLAIGDYDNALRVFDKGVLMHKQHNDLIGLANIYCNKGMAYEGMESWNESIKFNLKSVTIYERLGSLRFLWNAYINTSRLYARMENLVMAEEQIQKAKKILEVIHMHRGNAESKRVEGLICYLKNDWDDAIDFLDQSIECCIKNKDLYGQADTFRERGYMYIKKEQKALAVKNLKQAEQLFSSIGSKGDAKLARKKREELQIDKI